MVLGGSLLLGSSWVGIAAVLQIDSLKQIKANLLGSGQSQGLHLGRTQVRVYHEGKRTTSAVSDGVTVAWDRSRMVMTGVRNGTYILDDGRPMAFTSKSIAYELYVRQMKGEETRFSQGKDQLLMPSFVLDERSQVLTARKGGQGTFAGGRLRAGEITWNLTNKIMRAKPVVWSGELALAEMQGQPAQRRKWEFRAEDVQVNGDLRVYLTARATDGEVIMQAPRIEHNIKTDVVLATGGVKYWGLEANLAAPKMTVYRKEGRSVATGGVTLLLKPEKEKGLKEEEIPPFVPLLPEAVTAGRPEPAVKSKDDEVRDPKTIRDYPVAVRAAEITYWYREGQRRAIITGSPQARQDLPENRWRRVWAHEAYYDGEADILTLKSKGTDKDARLKASTGDDFKAIEFTISTKEDDDRWSAKKPEGVSYLDDDDDPRKSGGSGSGGAGGSKPPSLRGRIGA